MADNQEKILLSFKRRLRYALTPKKLYARYRANRDLRRYESELHFLPFLVDPNRNAIDGGANRGSYCYFLSRLCQHVHAFEPNPVMRNYLEKAVNKNVTVHPEALSDTKGHATFAIPLSDHGYRNTSGTLETDVYANASYNFTVDTIPLDLTSIENIGFIKLDVEGSELRAIRGAQKILQRDKPVLLVEIMEELTKQPVTDSVLEISNFGYLPLALVDDRLTDFNKIDPQRFAPNRPDYHNSSLINNFIFLPRT